MLEIIRTSIDRPDISICVFPISKGKINCYEQLHFLLDQAVESSSMAMVGSAYNLKGRWKEAEELEVQVMETIKRVLGEEHLDTLTSIKNLAFTFKVQGRNDEAILLLEKCTQLRKKVLGARHPYTTSLLATLNGWQLESMEIGV